MRFVTEIEKNRKYLLSYEKAIDSFHLLLKSKDEFLINLKRVNELFYKKRAYLQELEVKTDILVYFKVN